MSTTPLNFFDDEELLPLDNVLEFLKIAIDEGVKKIRITGGESRYSERMFHWIL